MEPFDRQTQNNTERQQNPWNIKPRGFPHEKQRNPLEAKPRGFTQIRNTLLIPNNLDVYEKMIIIILRKYIFKKEYCWPSIKTIAGDAGCSESTVKKKIKSLQSKKYVGKTRSDKYRSNVYKIPM